MKQGRITLMGTRPANHIRTGTIDGGGPKNSKQEAVDGEWWQRGAALASKGAMIASFEKQLGFQVRDTILPMGTFPAPEVEYTSRSWDDRLLVSPTDGVAGNYFLDDDITFLLPKGKATRWKLDPRILVFRGIPKPRAVAGAVFEFLDSRWVLDSRAMAASLVLELHLMVELVIVGDSGTVDMYRVLRDEPRHPRDTITPATN